MRRFVVLGIALALFGGWALAINGNGQFVQGDGAGQALAAFPEARTLNVDERGVPTFVAGRLGNIGRGDVVGESFHFLKSLRPVLQARGSEEFAPVSNETDRLGYSHVKFQQYINGLPVVGGEMVVHTDRNGDIVALNGKFVPDEDLPRRAEIDAVSAFEIAAGNAGIFQGRVLDQPTLTYVVENDKGYLAWTARIAYQYDGWEHIDQLFADARTGDMVTRHAITKQALNRKVYNGNHTDPNNPTLPGTLMISEGGSSTDVNAQDVYTNFGYTYNYYKNTYGRDSFDNAGATLIGTTHVGTNWVNAYWNGSQMVFGDGNGTDASYLSHALDVVAHELTHAVTERTANLTYAKDSGALNEAMSDIFGAAVEEYRDGAVSANTWLVGEAVWTPATSGDALRYMNNPTIDGYSTDYYPERMYASGCTPSNSNDECGVHGNSGIANLAFYLLTQGGTHPRSKTTQVVTGIGITKSAAIFYRALTTGLMTASTDYPGARTATKTAAEQLYGVGSTEATQTDNCWIAVGVGSGTSTTVTTLTNGVGLGSQSGTTGAMAMYKITVPSGQTSLVVTTSGGTGDVDLYVKKAAQPSTSSYDARGYTSGNAETVTISSPAAADYYIGLNAYSTYSGVTVKATYSGTTAGFGISASPTTVTVNQGASGTSTITTTVTGGFSSAIALTASGTPSGATISFSPTSITGAGTSTMTLNSGTAAAGTYTITVTGTSGTTTHTATVSWVINTVTTADFAIAASPTTVSVTQGTAGTSTITTTVSGGFSSAIALTASGTPSGATISFSPTSITGAGTSTMTLNSGTAAVGTYSITVTGTGGSKTHTATVSFVIGTSGGVVVLSNGVAKTGLGGATGTWTYYKITVPASQTNLVIAMSGGTGDADMYVKLGAQPTSSVYDYRPYLSGNNESVSVTNPTAGDWYIGLYAYSTYASVSLTATYSTGGGGTTMNETESNNTTATANAISTTGTTVTGYVGSTTDVDYFKVSLAASKTLALSLTVPSGKDYDLALYDSNGTTLLKSSTNGSGAAESISYTNGTTAKTVYIKVYGYNSAYSTTLSYKLKATW
jgi:Zn-dependent metalloprotease